jgi:hypothetical protein
LALVAIVKPTPKSAAKMVSVGVVGLTKGGHGGAPSFDDAWWNVMVQSQCAQMLAKLLAKQPPPTNVAKSIIDNGGVETLLTASAPPTHSR